MRPPATKPKDLFGQPWLLAFALRADGWYLRSEIIWARPNPMPESVTDRPTKSHSHGVPAVEAATVLLRRRRDTGTAQRQHARITADNGGSRHEAARLDRRHANGAWNDGTLRAASPRQRRERPLRVDDPHPTHPVRPLRHLAPKTRRPHDPSRHVGTREMPGVREAVGAGRRNGRTAHSRSSGRDNARTLRTGTRRTYDEATLRPAHRPVHDHRLGRCTVRPEGHQTATALGWSTVLRPRHPSPSPAPSSTRSPAAAPPSSSPATTDATPSASNSTRRTARSPPNNSNNSACSHDPPPARGTQPSHQRGTPHGRSRVSAPLTTHPRHPHTAHNTSRNRNRSTTTSSKLQHSQHVVTFFETHSWLRAPRHENCASIPWQNQCRIARRVYRQHLARIKEIQTTIPYTNDWKTAVRLAQKVFPGTEQWLLYISDREGGWGPFVMNHQGSGAGGWLQFMPSRSTPTTTTPRPPSQARGFTVDPKVWTWTHPLGQALTGAYMRYTGRDGCHWCL